ncbi:ABC transporter permease [Mitsuokella jalaludinii]|uniref:ABC transporter permease n=1 Tax=Mitsuokella jalaludinii TaxID=187979 RepID=UPI00307EFFA3
MNAFIKELYKYKYLIQELVVRDIKKKYRRSVLGVVWSILNPLLMMAVTAMVFSTLFRFDIKNYPLYLLTGQILFTFFAESTNFAMSSIIDNGGLIRKIYIPKYLFPLSRVVSSCVNLLFTFPALLLIILVTGQPLTLEMISFLIPLFLFFFFCLGVGLILSTMAVYFRDMFHLYGVLINLLSYATPIFYPEKIVPAQFILLLKLNPLYYFFKAFRMSIYDGVLPSAPLLFHCTLLAAVTFFVGCYVFKRYQNRFILYI